MRIEPDKQYDDMDLPHVRVRFREIYRLYRSQLYIHPLSRPIVLGELIARAIVVVLGRCVSPYTRPGE